MIDYFDRSGIPIMFLGEEGMSVDQHPQIALISDELDGTNNADQDITHL